MGKSTFCITNQDESGIKKILLMIKKSKEIISDLGCFKMEYA
jgi:hypothetical protein